MLVALAPDHEFTTPRTQFEPDIEDIFARVPASITTKGMFFNAALTLAEDPVSADDLLRAAGLEPERLLSFTDYPWVDFLRLNVAIGDLLCAGDRAIGMRRVGRTLYSEFADSPVGRMLFGLLRYNADRVIGMGATAWNMSGGPGEVQAVSVGDCHYHYHFSGYPSDVTETLGIGVLEGALHACNEVARVSFARADAMHGVVDIQWG